MKIFLTLKHWQLFAITFGLPIIIQILGIVFVLGMDKPDNIILINLSISYFNYCIRLYLFWLVLFGWNKFTPKITSLCKNESSAFQILFGFSYHLYRIYMPYYF
jgi:hypothetical protein